MEFNSFVYSLPYIVVFLLFLLLSYFELNSKYKMYTVIIANFIFIFFIGFRGFIGHDWYTYYKTFNAIPNISELNFSNFDELILTVNHEIGYVLLVSFFKFFINDFNLFVAFLTTVNFVILSLFLKRYSVNYSFSLAIYFVTAMNLQFNLLRNLNAVMLFLLSFKYIENKQIVKYFLVVTLATTMHISAVVFYPLYFFLNKKPNKILMWSILILGNLVFLTHFKFVIPILMKVSTIIGGKIEILANAYLYNDSYNFQHPISIGYIERTFTYILLCLKLNTLVSAKRSNVLFINSYLIFTIIFLFFSEFEILIDRFASSIFIYPYWILWPALIYNIRRKSYKIGLISFIVIFNLVKVATTTSFIYFDYDNILLGIKSYEERAYILGRFFDL